MSKIQPVCKICLCDIDESYDNLCNKCRDKKNRSIPLPFGNNYKVKPRPELRGN